MKTATGTERECVQANWETFYKLSPSEPYLPKDCDQAAIRGLTASAFHVFEDGAEQKILSVTAERLSRVTVRDNFVKHFEWSYTQRGEWSSVDLGADYSPIGTVRHFYVISYALPSSEEGSCHNIKVEVDDRDALVFARDEYCNTEHSATDFLNGTPLAERMNARVASPKTGKIPLSIQAAFFYTGADAARINIALEFPWNRLNHEWKDGSLHASIGVVGMIYKKDGTLAARFSDFACCASSMMPTDIRQSPLSRLLEPHDYNLSRSFEPIEPPANNPQVPISEPSGPYDYARLRRFDPVELPTRYETQVDLPPGGYDIRVVLSDGSKYGYIETPLIIDAYDGKQLALSSIALSRRVRDSRSATPEDASADLAPEYVALVSEDVQVTPTADIRFGRRDILVAYFEIYDLLLATRDGTALEVRLGIIDTKTGKLTNSVESVDATPYLQSGSSSIHVARVIPTDKLPKGSYRLEVQATDSTGRRAVHRSASFIIE
jgi:hypothetical protein